MTCDEPLLDLDNIQGNIVPGFKKDCQHFLFFRIVQPELSRIWLKIIAARFSTAREVLDSHALWKQLRRRRGHDPDTLDFMFMNCALSHTGLEKLEVPKLNEFDDAAFKVGIEERAGLIGDPASGSGQPGAPDDWIVGAGRKQADLLLILGSDNLKWAISMERELTSQARKHGLQLIHVDRGHVRPGDQAGHEHFGFKDGISHPAIRGCKSSQHGDYVEPRTWPEAPEFDSFRARFAGPGRPLIWPGHFLFGYSRQKRDMPEEARPDSNPPGPEWASNGSFLVYRRLTQNVAGFHNFLAQAAQTLRDEGFDPNMSPEKLGAHLVGRWVSGWPIMRDRMLDIGRGQPGENYFSFATASTVALPEDPHPLNAEDASGNICPFAAHIRKVNPRDDPTDLGPMERTLQRLMLRRGITFGPEMDQPNEERGLLFVSYQSSIVSQFEFLMNEWVNTVNKPHDQGGADPLISAAGNTSIRLSNGAVPKTLDIPGGWVHASGGAYMFAPSIDFFESTL
jgi:Dyp-type peroxidase family